MKLFGTPAEAPQGLVASHLSRRSGPLKLPLGTRAGPPASLGPALGPADKAVGEALPDGAQLWAVLEDAPPGALPEVPRGRDREM